MTVSPLFKDPVPTFNWAFENQPIMSGILTQPRRYKRVACNLLADEKGPQRVAVWLYIDSINLFS